MDLDDTLISTQEMFEEAKLNCATFIQEKIETKHKPSTDNIIKVFNEYEKELLETYGLQNKRFVLSWGKTYQFFLGSFDHEGLREVKRMASKVFRQSARILDDAVEVLDTLKERGYSLHLLTSGEEETQLYRVEDANIGHYFDAITVVLGKDVETYNRFVSDKPHSVMVGNSMSSDINPSLENGMFAIHVDGNNWFYDHAERIDSDRYTFAALKDVPNVIAKIEKRIEQEEIQMV